MRELSLHGFQCFAPGRLHHTDDDLLRHGWSLTLLPAKTAHPSTVLPLPILIKCTYVLVLLLSFFCLNSLFPYLDPIYYSKMSLEWDSFKRFHYGLWTYMYIFDFKPNWAKYLGFLMDFSQTVIIILVDTEEYHRKELHCLGGNGTRAALQFSFVASYSIHGEAEMGEFPHFQLEKEHLICKTSSLCLFLG